MWNICHSLYYYLFIEKFLPARSEEWCEGVPRKADARHTDMAEEWPCAHVQQVIDFPGCSIKIRGLVSLILFTLEVHYLVYVLMMFQYFVVLSQETWWWHLNLHLWLRFSPKSYISFMPRYSFTHYWGMAGAMVEAATPYPKVRHLSLHWASFGGRNSAVLQPQLGYMTLTTYFW